MTPKPVCGTTRRPSNDEAPDPIFVDPGSGDGRLGAGSPCVDTGNNWGVAADFADADADGNTTELVPLDLDGSPRFADDPARPDDGCGVPVVVDMGAFEVQGAPATVLFGDVNGDGRVGIADLVALVECTGSRDPVCCVADLDLDGAVGMQDVSLLGAELTGSVGLPSGRLWSGRPFSRGYHRSSTTTR